MGSNILGIGQSALAAAQMGINVTGHNIANAATPGYNRQILLQTAMEPQSLGGSFVGQGVAISKIQRQYNAFLTGQINSSQTTKNQVETYYSQITQINNLVADPTAGVTPALQDLFKGVQNLASSPNGTAGAAARQAALSNAESMVGRFNSLQNRLDQISTDINDQVINVVSAINSYSSQLADLNETIEKAQSVGPNAIPNDLLDQRDQVVTELSKLTKVSVVEQGAKYNIFIGSGQPLVLGSTAYDLKAVASYTDPTRMEVAYTLNGTDYQIPESSLPGGKLAGLFDFRSTTLEQSRNSLGRIALGLASAFNDQQALGLDLNGQQGTKLFNVSGPVTTASSLNTTTARVDASVYDTNALTTSDYRVQYSGGNYKITRLSDGVMQTATSLPIKIDGLNISLAPAPSPAPANGDEFLIRPTATAAGSLSVAIKDPAKLAAAAPFTTTAPTTNTGTGKISVGVQDSPVAAGSTSTTATISPVKVDDSYINTSLSAPLTLTYNAGAVSGFPAGSTVTVKNGATTTSYAAPVASIPYASGAEISFDGMSFTLANSAGAPANGDTFTLSPAVPVASTTLSYNGGNIAGFPAGANVTVTNGSTKTTYPAGATIPYTNGATYSYNGISFTATGTPANGDVFQISPNQNGSGDNRNAVILGSFQTQNTMINGTTSFQGAFSQFVSVVGNKAAELKTNLASETKLLQQATQAQQAESGVNLDEEATNLLRYQQAYQAAGKLMQIASTLFDALLQLGGR